MSIKFRNDIIENEKTIIIPIQFDLSNIAEFQISNIEFEPDEIVLNSVTFIDSSATPADTADIIILTSNLPLNTNQLCALPNLAGVGSITKLDSYFKVIGPINGLYTFCLNNIKNGNPTTDITTFDYYVSLTLTFTKYKSVR